MGGAALAPWGKLGRCRGSISHQNSLPEIWQQRILPAFPPEHPKFPREGGSGMLGMVWGAGLTQKKGNSWAGKSLLKWREHFPPTGRGVNGFLGRKSCSGYQNSPREEQLFSQRGQIAQEAQISNHKLRLGLFLLCLHFP